MRLSTAGIAAALLGLAMGMGTRQLDPVVNMCVRFNHQCM